MLEDFLMENLGLIIAIVGSAVGIIGVIIMLFLWVRGEANADRRSAVDLIFAIKEDIKSVQLEMKDFHLRLEKQDYEFRQQLLSIAEGKKK